mgnify:FL=1
MSFVKGVIMIRGLNVEELLRLHKDRVAKLEKEAEIAALLRAMQPSGPARTSRLGERLFTVIRLLCPPNSRFPRGFRVNGN